jgi:hypothetical protein
MIISDPYRSNELLNEVYIWSEPTLKQKSSPSPILPGQGWKRGFFKHKGSSSPERDDLQSRKKSRNDYTSQSLP